MGVRIVEGKDGSQTVALLYCSVSMWAFGPVFDDWEMADDFLNWLNQDARRLSDHELRTSYHNYLESREENGKRSSPVALP